MRSCILLTTCVAGLLIVGSWAADGNGQDLLGPVQVEFVDAQKAEEDTAEVEEDAKDGKDAEDEDAEEKKEEKADARAQEQQRVARVKERAAKTAAARRAADQKRAAQIQALRVRQGEAQGNQAEQQIQNATNLLKPMLETELSFANRACELTAAQREEVILAGKALLQDLAKDYVEKQRDPNARNRIVLGGAFVQRGAVVVGGQSTDFEQEVEDALTKLLSEIITDAQLTKFKSEMGERREFQQQVVVDALVAKIEESLYLTDQQREKITQSLVEGWDSQWAPNLMVLEQYSNYMPALPDKLVVPHLTPSQKTRWDGMMKISANSGLQMFHNNFAVIQDIKLDN